MSANLTPEGRRGVETYSAGELHRMLVEDAVQNHATDLAWMTGALQRIQQLTKRSLEDVFTAVVMEVESLGAHMPIASGPM